MSRIKKDIERYMEGPARSGSTLTSSFMFPSEFIGFQGHFPTTKVLPGACQIQCVISTIEKALAKRVALKEIMLAKYIAPIYPGDVVICAVSEASAEGMEFIYKTRITKGTEKIAELKLRVSVCDAI